MKRENFMELKFLSKSQNEGFARVCAGAFATQLDPTLEELADIKTAVSEAVTNAIVHGYRGAGGIVTLSASINGQLLIITIEDEGEGIEDIMQARQPMFSTIGSDERSGMGFTVMEMLMDEVLVSSKPGQGTKVTMKKRIGQE